MRSLLIFASILLVSSLQPVLAVEAQADPLAPSFGTTLVVTVESRIIGPDGGWWASAFPTQLTQTPAYLAGLINARRLLSDGTALLVPTDQIIGNYGEYEANGRWEYRFDFVDLEVEEVKWTQEAIKLDSCIPAGGTVSYRPLLTRNFYISTNDLDKPMRLPIGEKGVEVHPLSSIAAAHEAVAAGLTRAYGDGIAFDISFSQNMNRSGYNSASISVYAELLQ